MKKRKIGLWLNIVTICLSLCAIAVGVYSAKQVKLGITGSLSFTAYSNASVVCKVVGAQNGSGVISTDTNPFYLTTDGVSTSEQVIKMTKDMEPLNFSSLNFAYDNSSSDKTPYDIVFTFTITNTSAETVVADLNIDELKTIYVSATVDEYVRIIRGMEDNMSTGDITASNTATITLTLKLLKNMTIEQAVGGSMMLNILPAKQTDSGFAVYGKEPAPNALVSVPVPASGVTSITLPAYLYDGSVFTRIYSISGMMGTSITNLGNYKEIIVSNGITTLYSLQGSGKQTLESVKIPNSVTRFNGTSLFPVNSMTDLNFIAGGFVSYFATTCQSLQNLTFGTRVTFGIDGFSFWGLSKTLTSIKVEYGNAVYDSRNNCNAVIITATNKLTLGCINTVIPNSVTSLGSYAFQCCQFTSINIPNSITNIDYRCFVDCDKLTTINYNGPKAQWNSITFGSEWDAGTGNYTIHCTDGDIG